MLLRFSQFRTFILVFYTGVGKMRLVRLGASVSSNVCNSYQIKPITLVHTLYLPLTLFSSFFPYSKPNNTCPKRNRYGSGASVVFTLNSVTNTNAHQPIP